MINPAKLLKFKNAWETFRNNHPKFPKFLSAVQKNAVQEGTIIEINVTNASGETLSSNIKLKESDVELFKQLSGMF